MMNFLENTDKKYFFIIAFLTVLTTSILGSYIIGHFVGEETLSISYFENKSLVYIFFTTVLIGPLLETFIFQFGVIEIILFVKKNHFFEFLAIVLSSILFGISHNYNFYYIIFGIIIGIILAIIYIVAKRRDDMNAFLIIFIIHIFTNLVAFLYNDIFELG